MEPETTLCLTGDPDMERKIVRWIEGTCDTVVWTNYGRRPLVPGFCRPWESHPGFKSAMHEFQEEFEGEFTDRLEYGTHEGGRTFRHYRFRIDGPVRDALRRNGVAYNSFPGLWDPCYYAGKDLLASAVGHENLITVFVPLSEIRRF